MHQTFREIRREHKGIPDGICLPLSIDAGLQRHELPREWYDYFFDGYQNGLEWSGAISYFLREFYKVEPQPETEYADVAKFNRFGQSHQLYTPRVEIDPESKEKQSAQLLHSTLGAAARAGCLVMFNVQTPGGEHTKLLDCVDPHSPYGAMYVVRDWGTIGLNDRTVYSVYELAGEVHPSFTIRDHNAPLPEVSRRAFPSGETSWELAIFPPEEYLD